MSMMCCFVRRQCSIRVCLDALKVNKVLLTLPRNELAGPRDYNGCLYFFCLQCFLNCRLKGFHRIVKGHVFTADCPQLQYWCRQAAPNWHTRLSLFTNRWA